jgi:ceramide glucosyltransferase
MLAKFLLLLVIFSWVYWLVALWFSRRFFQKEIVLNKDFTPPVSILKPVKGLDAQPYLNFSSFCRQDYPEYEILFGVSDLDDPVIPVIRRLQREFPTHKIQLVVVSNPGPNRKACILQQLATKANHEILAVSDSDMRVTPDYLRRVVGPLSDNRVGMVTCPYRGFRPLTFTARLEALHMGVTFLPSVLIARGFLGGKFALGASMVLRKRDLAKIGGFDSVVEYLADDYQLGKRIANLGLKVHLSRYIIRSVLGATNFKEQWHREVRWAHTNRVCQPAEYPGLILTFSTALALLFLLFTDQPLTGWLVLATSLLVRWLVGWYLMDYIGDAEMHDWLVWLPVRDLLSATVWFFGLIGNKVVWRGLEYTLLPDGKLELRSGLSDITEVESGPGKNI